MNCLDGFTCALPGALGRYVREEVVNSKAVEAGEEKFEKVRESGEAGLEVEKPCAVFAEKVRDRLESTCVPAEFEVDVVKS